MRDNNKPRPGSGFSFLFFCSWKVGVGLLARSGTNDENSKNAQVHVQLTKDCVLSWPGWKGTHNRTTWKIHNGLIEFFRNRTTAGEGWLWRFAGDQPRRCVRCVIITDFIVILVSTLGAFCGHRLGVWRSVKLKLNWNCVDRLLLEQIRIVLKQWGVFSEESGLMDEAFPWVNPYVT